MKNLLTRCDNEAAALVRAADERLTHEERSRLPAAVEARAACNRNGRIFADTVRQALRDIGSPAADVV